MWSWANLKHGIGNLAEHRVLFHKRACKNNLVLQHGLNEPLCSGQGLKLVTTSWKCAFLKKYLRNVVIMYVIGEYVI
jgi:hypothetical protein